MITGVDHAAIAALSSRTLADWYCQALGMRVLFQNEADPPTFLVGRDRGALIEIMPANADPRPDRAFFAPGISHLALTVADLDQAIGRLRALGVEPAEPVEAAGGGRIANFLDPEGNALQLIVRTRDLRSG